jgi:hydroxymethylglutaryl-CoA synthase
MGVTAIESVGSYLPRYRITGDTVGDAWDGFRARGVTAKRVPAADEDAVTMAVSACEDALGRADSDRSSLTTLAVGTTTPPLEEGDIGVTIAEILGLDETVEITVHTQSTRAGTRALLEATRATEPALAVAADCPRGSPGDAIEHAAGAGAVAAVTGDSGAVVTDTATYAQEYPGTRFRERGVDSYDATAYERDAYVSTLSGALDSLSDVPAALVPTSPDGSLPGRLGRAADDATVYHLADELGDTGAASPLFGLLAAWNADETRVGVLGYGSGASVDAVVVEGTLPVDWTRPAEEISYAEYLRQRGFIPGGEN